MATNGAINGVGNGSTNGTTNGRRNFPIPENHWENGRLFHGYHRGVYMFPCDEAEKDRLDMFHTIFNVARHNKLHTKRLIPTYENPRILDLGTGTGIWAIAMADKYPHAEVVGLDLVNIQPAEIPPNLRFRVPRDFESPWFLGDDCWDLIHLRLGYGSVSSWAEMYHNVYQHLKPGYGHFEQVEIDFRPRCDDGTLPHYPIVKWYEDLEDATSRANRSIKWQEDTEHLLEAVGFVDIEIQTIRLPFNTWPTSDRHSKAIGRWYGIGLGVGIEALSLGPLTRVYRWPPDEVIRYATEVRQAMENKDIHAYNNLYIVSARKPGPIHGPFKPGPIDEELPSPGSTHGTIKPGPIN